MVKTASTVVLGLILVLTATGAATAAGSAKYGAKIGITVADQDYDYDDAAYDINVDPDSRTGIAIGLFLEKPLVKNVAVRGEADFFQKGSQLTVLRTNESGEPLGSEKIQDRVTYISLSGLGRVNVPIAGLSTYVMAGPRLDFKVSSDSEFGAVLDSDLNSTIFGLTFSVGQEFNLPSFGSLFVELDYHHDLGDAYEDEGVKVKNRALAIMAGIMF
jgi:hypothetical protein